jgi:hypothetical protein
MFMNRLLLFMNNMLSMRIQLAFFLVLNDHKKPSIIYNIVQTGLVPEKALSHPHFIFYISSFPR